IGQDGAVFQLVRLRDSAWGNGIPVHPRWPLIAERTGVNPNRYTVSIEHAKPSADNSDPLTPAQLRASVSLVRWLLAALPDLGLDLSTQMARCAACTARFVVSLAPVSASTAALALSPACSSSTTPSREGAPSPSSRVTFSVFDLNSRTTAARTGDASGSAST